MSKSSIWPDLDGLARVSRLADRVEIKVIVPEHAHEQILAALRSGRDARTRTLYYLDTPDLQLARCGVVVRARHLGGGSGRCDSVVKLRRSGPAVLPGPVLRSANLRTEIDALPGLSLWSAALTGSVRPPVLRAATRGRLPLSTLLSAEQSAFFTSCTGGELRVEDLVVHGPVTVTRMPTGTAGSGKMMTVESWLYADGTRLLEVSTKCAAARAVRVARETEMFLGEHGVDRLGPQETKTRVTLAHLTRVSTAQGGLAAPAARV